MRIQLFKNTKGIIHGSDPMRIGCDREGVLKIGTTEVKVSPNEDSNLPLLFHGATGDYSATFADKDGLVFELEKVSVRGGRITPPSSTAVEFMELRCKSEAMEKECASLRARIRALETIFDTNSLNFLIK